MKRKISLLAVLAILFGLFVNSCQKTYEPDKATGNDNTQADYVMFDIFMLSHQETGGEKASALIDSTCMNVSFYLDTTDNGIVVHKDITFNNCDAFGNGVVRNGTVHFVYDLGWILNEDKKLTITFENYYRNDIKVEGTIEVSFDGYEDKNPKYKIYAKNMKLTFADSTYTTWDSEREVTWLEGFNTPGVREDNKLEVSYERKGVNRKGIAYTADAEDLYFDASCQYNMPLSGTLEITKEDGSNFEIDFGNGECDNCVIYKSGDTEVQVCGD